MNIKTIYKEKKDWIIGILSVSVPVALAYFSYKTYKKRNRKIFISYHSKNDANYKNMLSAWNENREFELTFDDESVGVSINTNNESRIKAGITRKLNKSNLVLCIVGEETYKRPMVNWELQKAKDLNKKIIVVKTKSYYKTPSCLLNSSIVIIKKFEKESIIKEIYKS